jgi:hypothetical protein
MTNALAGLKTALHLLVQKLGGVEAAASVIGRNAGRISDATSRASDTMLPAHQVVALEAVAHEPLVTAAMARALGYRLIRDGVAAEPDTLIPARLGAVAQDVGALMQTVASAVADGVVEERERAEALSILDEARASLELLAAAVRRGA